MAERGDAGGDLGRAAEDALDVLLGERGDLDGAVADTGEELVVVTTGEEDDVQIGMELADTSQLAMFPGDQALLHGGELDVEIVLGQIEVGGEHFGDSISLPAQGEGGRLIEPGDAVEVEELSELGFRGVGEGDASKREGMRSRGDGGE